MEVQAKVAEIALPVALLYATHAHSSVALAAHVLFCAIVRHADVVCAACLAVWVTFHPTGSLQDAHVVCAASGKSVCAHRVHMRWHPVLHFCNAHMSSSLSSSSSMAPLRFRPAS